MRRQAFLWVTGMTISPNNSPDGEKGSFSKMPNLHNMTDGDLHNFLHNVVTVTNGNLPGYGLTAEDIASASASDTDLSAKIAVCVQIAENAKAATVAKNETRTLAEKNLRTLLNKIANDPSVTDSLRTAIGLSAADATPSAAPVPTTYPEFNVVLDARLHHVVNYHDSASPLSKAKPTGVHAVEVWAKIGDPAPAGLSEMIYLGSDTSTPWEKTYSEADAGKSIYYALRWVNMRGEAGPWSPTIKATIPG